MITQKMIVDMANYIVDEWNLPYSEEFARLNIMDLQRKGCSVEYGHYCQNCPFFNKGECPLNDWEKRHPEFKNDELAQRIAKLEAELKKASR